MPRTITLSNIKILAWTVNPEVRNVTVAYQVLDQTGAAYNQGEAVFWAVMPPPPTDAEGNPGTLPANWYALPAAYRQVLLDLTTDIRTGLLHLLD